MSRAERDLVDAWLDAKGAGGGSYADCARRIGVPKTRLEKAIARARRAGDERVPLGRLEPQRRMVEDLDVKQTRAASSLEGEEIQRARVTAACHATDVDDLRALLDALGLGGDAA